MELAIKIIRAIIFKTIPYDVCIVNIESRAAAMVNEINAASNNLPFKLTSLSAEFNDSFPNMRPVTNIKQGEPVAVNSCSSSN